MPRNKLPDFDNKARQQYKERQLYNGFQMYHRLAYPLNHEIKIGHLTRNSKFYKELKINIL